MFLFFTLSVLTSCDSCVPRGKINFLSVYVYVYVYFYDQIITKNYAIQFENHALSLSLFLSLLLKCKLITVQWRIHAFR